MSVKGPAPTGAQNQQGRDRARPVVLWGVCMDEVPAFLEPDSYTQVDVQ